jgi:ubiquinone/menaquinone biosynthesis C-methylase UbiE
MHPADQPAESCLSFTGERVLPETGYDILQQSILAIHQAYYAFIQPYCHRQRVLDLGCGTGHGTALLQQQAGSLVWGTDIANEAIHYAVQYNSALINRLFVSDVLALPVPDETFDVVSTIEVIEHVPDATRMLHEICRVLRSDGRCLLSTPNRLTHSPQRSVPVNPFHVVEYSYTELLDLLKQSFAEVTIYCVVLKQRQFLVRYQRSALHMHLPPLLAAIERFAAWHMPIWKQRTLQPRHILLTRDYHPRSWGFLAVCARPLLNKT